MLCAGKVKGKTLFKVRQYHEAYQTYAARRFAESGHEVCDFFQTTRGRPEACGGDGVNFFRWIVHEHAKILANVLCNK